MNWLIVPADRKHELDALNNASRFKKLRPERGLKGSELLSTRPLEDCGPGQTWEVFGPFLKSLSIEEDDVKIHESIDISLAPDATRLHRQAICDICPFYNTKCTIVQRACVNCGKPERLYGTCPKNLW